MELGELDAGGRAPAPRVSRDPVDVGEGQSGIFDRASRRLHREVESGATEPAPDLGSAESGDHAPIPASSMSGHAASVKNGR